MRGSASDRHRVMQTQDRFEFSSGSIRVCVTLASRLISRLLCVGSAFAWRYLWSPIRVWNNTTVQKQRHYQIRKLAFAQLVEIWCPDTRIHAVKIDDLVPISDTKSSENTNTFGSSLDAFYDRGDIYRHFFVS